MPDGRTPADRKTRDRSRRQPGRTRRSRAAGQATRPARETGNRSPRLLSPEGRPSSPDVPWGLSYLPKLWGRLSPQSCIPAASNSAPPYLSGGAECMRPVVPYWLNVALEAAAETGRPWELRVPRVILRLAGTPFGRLNEKEPNELSSEPIGLLLGRFWWLLVCRP